MLNKITALISLKMRLSIGLIAAFACILPTQISQAQDSQTITLYLPTSALAFPQLQNELQSSLNKAGLSNITVQTLSYWQQHQQRIRKGKAGIYYAAPHFAAWMIHHHNFTPLLRNEEPLQYIIASNSNRADIFEVRDLQKQKICSQSALNLDYLLVNKILEHSPRPAYAYIVPLVGLEMKKDETPCAAFAINQHVFSKLQNDQSRQFTRLAQSELTNNYTFLAPPSFKTNHREQLTRFLQEKATIEVLTPLLQLYSTKQSLIHANKSDYPISYLTQLKKYWREHERVNLPPQ